VLIYWIIAVPRFRDSTAAPKPLGQHSCPHPYAETRPGLDGVPGAEEHSNPRPREEARPCGLRGKA
jgi:hypothetical protein